MDQLPLLIGAIMIIAIAFIIIRKVTAMMFKISIFGGFVIFLGILAYVFRDRLPL